MKRGGGDGGRCECVALRYVRGGCRKTTGEVAEGDAGGGHADGACEGDEEGGDGGRQPLCGVTEAGTRTAKTDWIVGQEKGESYKVVGGVTKALEEHGSGGEDFGGKGARY